MIKFLARPEVQNDHYLECMCDFDDEAEGLGAYWGGSLIVYVGWCTLSKEYAKTYSSRLGFW
jgi:hypothetical protein